MGNNIAESFTHMPELGTNPFAYPQVAPHGDLLVPNVHPTESAPTSYTAELAAIDTQMLDVAKQTQQTLQALDGLNKKIDDLSAQREELLRAQAAEVARKEVEEQVRLEREAETKRQAEQEAAKQKEKSENIAKIVDLLGQMSTFSTVQIEQALAVLATNEREQLVSFAAGVLNAHKKSKKEDDPKVEEQNVADEAKTDEPELISSADIPQAAAKSTPTPQAWPAPKVKAAFAPPSLDQLVTKSEAPVLPIAPAEVAVVSPWDPPVVALPQWAPPIFHLTETGVTPVVVSVSTEGVAPKRERNRRPLRALRFLAGAALGLAAIPVGFILTSSASSIMASENNSVESTVPYLPTETTSPTSTTVVLEVSSTQATAESATTTSTMAPVETTVAPLSPIARLKAGEITLQDLYGQPNLYSISAPTICLEAPVYGSNSSNTKEEQANDPLYYVLPDETPETACDTWQGQSAYPARWQAPAKGSNEAKAYGTAAALTPIFVMRTDSKGIVGENGTVAFEVHRTTYGAGGMNFDALRVGDEITITGDDGESYTFVKTSSETIDPSLFNQKVLDYVDPSGAPAVVVSSCDENGQVRFLTYFTLKNA